MKRFAGNCIDGPWRGRKVERDEPMFRVAVTPPMLALADPYELDQYVTFSQLWYIWVYSLGEWAIVDEGVNPRCPRMPKLWRYPEDVEADRKREAERLKRIMREAGRLK